ncbi:MAG: glycoside hydrolase family 3 C-terminal domain-containing protein, partial [Desulfovibrionaceae bacterium]|nr:glycoside hydrolase family 3 C-terminal domain-containing protein [Desulfovibrionaceae bacterium]
PHQDWQEGLKELVLSGRLPRQVIRQACARVLKVKFLLGLFDHPYVDESRAKTYVHSEPHRRLSREIARESVVLLKNSRGLLPLSKKTGKIAVLGPSAASAMLGDYTAGGR